MDYTEQFEMILAILQIVMMIVSVTLFFLGLRKVFRFYYGGKNPETEGYRTPEQAKKDTAEMRKGSLIFLAGGMLAFAGFSFCSLFMPMSIEGYNLFEIILQAVVNAFVNTGFLVLLPLVVRRRRH